MGANARDAAHSPAVHPLVIGRDPSRSGVVRAGRDPHELGRHELLHEKIKYRGSALDRWSHAGRVPHVSQAPRLLELTANEAPVVLGTELLGGKCIAVGIFCGMLGRRGSHPNA